MGHFPGVMGTGVLSQARPSATQALPPLLFDLFVAEETAVSPSSTQPTNQPSNKTNWQDNPINRYNLTLFVLILLP